MVYSAANHVCPTQNDRTATCCADTRRSQSIHCTADSACTRQGDHFSPLAPPCRPARDRAPDTASIRPLPTRNRLADSRSLPPRADGHQPSTLPPPRLSDRSLAPTVRLTWPHSIAPSAWPGLAPSPRAASPPTWPRPTVLTYLQRRAPLGWRRSARVCPRPSRCLSLNGRTQSQAGTAVTAPARPGRLRRRHELRARPATGRPPMPNPLLVAPAT